jgi:hypothetical protein
MYREKCNMKKEDEISDSEIWLSYHEGRTAKRWDNHKHSLQLLTDKGVHFKCLNESIGHYRVGDWDFWPTTGKFYNSKTGEKGRGVFELLKVVAPHKVKGE